MMKKNHMLLSKGEIMVMEMLDLKPLQIELQERKQTEKRANVGKLKLFLKF